MSCQMWWPFLCGLKLFLHWAANDFPLLWLVQKHSLMSSCFLWGRRFKRYTKDLTGHSPEALNNYKPDVKTCEHVYCCNLLKPQNLRMAIQYLILVGSCKTNRVPFIRMNRLFVHMSAAVCTLRSLEPLGDRINRTVPRSSWRATIG